MNPIKSFARISDSSGPHSTIANTAKGVGNPKLKLDSLVRLALAIRVKAMKTNLGMFTHGKKSLIDYSR